MLELEAAGVFVSSIWVVPYVNGLLPMTRTIGDVRLEIEQIQNLYSSLDFFYLFSQKRTYIAQCLY